MLPEGAPATEALAAFKRSGLPLALVVDERGNVEGLITPTDVLEALVGDLEGPLQAPVVRRGDGSPIRRQNLHRRSFKPLLEMAGLPNIRFHDLRHTFASIALCRGANINTVSKMLGHSSVKITLDVYGHLMPGMQAEALEHLDGMFS